MLVPDMRDHGQLYGRRIQSPPRGGPADAPAASQAGMRCNLPRFRGRTARELNRNGLRECFHKIVIFALPFDSGPFASALAVRCVGGTFLFGLLQRGWGDEKSLPLITFAGAAETHHDC